MSAAPPGKRPSPPVQRVIRASQPAATVPRPSRRSARPGTAARLLRAEPRAAAAPTAARHRASRIAPLARKQLGPGGGRYRWPGRVEPDGKVPGWLTGPAVPSPIRYGLVGVPAHQVARLRSLDQRAQSRSQRPPRAASPSTANWLASLAATQPSGSVIGPATVGLAGAAAELALGAATHGGGAL